MLSFEFLQFCSISKSHDVRVSALSFAVVLRRKAQSTQITHGFNPQLRSKNKSDIHDVGWQCRGRTVPVRKSVMYSPASLGTVIRPGPTRSENTRKIFLNFSSLLSRTYTIGPDLFNAEETTGPRTMYRNAKNDHHAGKTSFFSYKKHTLEVLMWKRVRRSQPPRQDVGLLSRNERGTTSIWKKIPGISARSRGYPDPATVPNWNTALSWLACLPALLHLLSPQQRSWARTTQQGHSAAVTDVP